MLTAAAQVTADNAPGFVGCVLLVAVGFWAWREWWS
jgi:hypothetical protein